MNTKHILFLLTLLLFSITAYSGYAQPAPVVIDLYAGGGMAGGDLISARNSANEFEFIGCGQRAYDDGAGGFWYWGFCQAQLEEASSVTCITQNPELLDGIDSIADSSYVTFSWSDDGEGNLSCTRIGSSTQSFYLEKSKKTK